MSCRCPPELDYRTRELLAGALYSAFVTECLIFRKSEWVADCGFILEEQYVEIPRNYEYQTTKVAFAKKCLTLLDEGWENDDATRLRPRLYELVKG
jgi:hypothetical protein